MGNETPPKPPTPTQMNLAAKVLRTEARKAYVDPSTRGQAEACEAVAAMLEAAWNMPDLRNLRGFIAQAKRDLEEAHGHLLGRSDLTWPEWSCPAMTIWQAEKYLELMADPKPAKEN